MNYPERIAWALAIVAIDLVAFALPLTALVVAYVMIARPPWFRQAVEDLYRDEVRKP